MEDEEWEEGVEYEEDEEGDEDEGEAARNDPVIPPDAEVTEYQEVCSAWAGCRARA